MLRREVDGEGAVALAAALVDVARRLVEDPKHGDEPVAGAVGAADEASFRSDVVDVQPDPARPFRDGGALAQRGVDPVDGIAFHRQKKTRAQLLVLGAGVEEGRGRMGHLFERHQIVGFFNFRKVLPVQGHRHPKPHVLRALNDDPVGLHQVGALQGLVAEIVEFIVAVELEHALVFVGVRHHQFVVAVLQLRPQGVGNVQEGFARAFVVVGDHDAACQDPKVGVVRHLGRTLLGGELVDVLGFDLVVQLVHHVDHQLCEVQRKGGFDGPPKGAHPPKDLVETDDFDRPVPFEHVHFFHGLAFLRPGYV